MSHWINNGTIYRFCSVFETSDDTTNVGIVTSSVASPKVLGDFQRIITLGGTGHFNHAPWVMEHPTDNTKLLMFISFRNVTADPLKIRVMEALKSDPTSWSVLYSDVIFSTVATVQQVYPFVWFQSGKYKMMYSRFDVALGETNFAVFYTESDNLQYFPEGKEVLSPTGNMGDFDGGYTSQPRRVNLYTSLTQVVYYQGRDTDAGAGSYIGIGVKSIADVRIQKTAY